MHADAPPMRARQRRFWQLGAAAVLMLAVIAIVVAASSSHAPAPLRPGRPVPRARAVNALLAGIPENGSALGSPQAPLTLVEFGDLQCPGCRTFATDVLPALVQRYIRSGRLQIVFRPVAFIGTDSKRAARAALAAGEQGRFWQFTELFYENQRDENSGYVTTSFVRALALAIPALDAGRVLSDAGLAGPPAPTVAAQLAQARAVAKRYGVQATPTFLLGRGAAAPNTFAPSDLSTGSFTSKLDALLRA